VGCAQEATLEIVIRKQDSLILKKLFKAELKRGEDVETHLNLLFTWMDELTERDFVLEDTMKIAIILSSLNEDYDTLITALEARDEDKLSIEDVE
jgi:hypothetical protein